MLVIDGSLAVELSLDRIGEQAGEVLGNDGDLIAPMLLWSEVPSALHEMVFRGEISTALAELGLQRFLAGKLGITEKRPDDLTSTAWQIAEDFGWAKTYDAEYVALAKLNDCRLVTVDGRLRRGADRLGFVVTPAELERP
jgi:predicted nucleic acid-binding protein